MFKETNEGTTHYENDGCGEPAHNQNNQDWKEKFVEKGANLEHDRWARWQKYFFSKCLIKPQSEVGGINDGFVYFALPKDLHERWLRQIDTPYSELLESEKESDRKETRNYLPFIEQTIHQETAKAVENKIKEIGDKRLEYLSHTQMNFEEANGWNMAIRIENEVLRKTSLQPTNNTKCNQCKLEGNNGVCDRKDCANNTKEERCNQIVEKGGTYNAHCYNIKPCPIHNTKE